jgi:aerobic carbon-monoxide dehydrogenase medium subunit
MYQFTYHRPKSLEEAAKIFTGAGEPRFLAGGHTLLPAMKLRLNAPTDLIDLSAVPGLSGISRDGNAIAIGAMTRHADVATSAEVKKSIPALAHLAEGIGDPLVRHMGTIGGSLANNDPAADYPAAVLGLGATVHTTKRQIPADTFFKGMFETALEPGEIISKIVLPVPERAGYMKFPNPASRYAMVGVFVAKTGADVRVAVTGAGPVVFRAQQMEAALAKSFTPDAVASIKIGPAGLNSDLHGSAEYRAHLVTVMAKRAVAAAMA